MAAVLSQPDMFVTRNFLRWAGVGTQPSQACAASVMEITKNLDAQASSMVRRVAEEVSRGVLPSQENCKAAQAQLKELFESGPNADIERGENDRA